MKRRLAIAWFDLKEVAVPLHSAPSWLPGPPVENRLLAGESAESQGCSLPEGCESTAAPPSTVNGMSQNVVREEDGELCNAVDAVSSRSGLRTADALAQELVKNSQQIKPVMCDSFKSCSCAGSVMSAVVPQNSTISPEFSPNVPSQQPARTSPDVKYS